MDFNLFRKSIIDDIEMNFNDWINWNMEHDVEVLKEREEDLRTKLSVAKECYKNMLKQEVIYYNHNYSKTPKNKWFYKISKIIEY